VPAGDVLVACPVYISFCGDEQPANFELLWRDSRSWSAGKVQWGHSSANKKALHNQHSATSSKAHDAVGIVHPGCRMQVSFAVDKELTYFHLVLGTRIKQWSGIRPFGGPENKTGITHVYNITLIPHLLSNAHVVAGVLLAINAGWVCNHVVAHELGRAIPCRVENVCLAYDSRDGGSLQKRKR
jgi:hypothetical protein